MLPILFWVWGRLMKPGQLYQGLHSPFKKTESLFLRSHQLSIAPWAKVEADEPLINTIFKRICIGMAFVEQLVSVLTQKLNF